MFLSGEIEKWGTGIKNIYKKCKEENIKVRFEDRKTAFFVVVYRKDLGGLIENTEKDLQGTKKFLEKFPEKFLKNEKKLLEKISENPNITQTELSNILGVTTRAVRKTMKNLKDKGIIERIGSDRKGYWKIIK